MATLVLGAVGAAVGGAIGGTVFGISATAIGWSVGSTLGGLVGGSQKIPTTYGPRLGDLTVTSSAYGKPIPKVYGSYRLAGNVIWGQRIRETEHRTKVKTGGKGGGKKKATQITYTYSQTFAVGICKGEILGIRRIWMNGKLWYNVSDTASLATINASAAAAKGFTLYRGTESQMPNSVIQASVGAANCPAYRGLAYIVFYDLQLEDFGNRMPNIEFEVIGTGFTNQYDVIGTVNGGFDRKPMLSADERKLYVPDWQNSRITVVDTSTNAVLSQIPLPAGYLNAGQFDISGNKLYVGNHNGNKSLHVINLDSDALVQTYSPDIGRGGIVIANDRYDHIYHFESALSGKIRVFNKNTLNLVATVDVSNKEFLAAAMSPNNKRVFAFHASLNRITRFSCDTLTTASVQSTDGQPHVLCVISDDKLYVGCASGMAIVNGEAMSITSSRPISNIRAFAYQNGVVFAGAGTTIYVFDAQTDVQIKTLTAGGTVTTMTISSDNKTLFVGYGSSVQIIDVDSGAVIKTISGLGSMGIYEQATLLLNAAETRLYVQCFRTNLYVIDLAETIPNSDIPLSHIVEDICGDVGLVPAQLDTTELLDNVTGYCLTNRSNARANLEPLASAYFFDCVEIDGKLKFVKRGGQIKATIREDELFAHEWGSEAPQSQMLERTQDVELPDEVSVQYADRGAAYQVGVQYSRRLIGSSSTQTDIQLPIAMSNARAKQIADVLMYDAWQGRIRFNFTTTVKYSYLTPADVVMVEKDGQFYTLRIVTKNENGLLLDFEAAIEDLQVYNQNAPAPSLPVPSDDIEIDGPTALMMLDIPLLRDNDQGFYSAAYGFSDSWPGAQIFRSTDNGSSWLEFGQAHTFPTTAGQAVTALGNFPRNVFDETNTVTVTLSSGELFSEPESAILNGENAALLGNEIIQFKNADLVGQNTYLLSGMLRGRKGTEWARGSHAIGDRFILLQTTENQSIALAELNVNRIYRGVTFGDFVDEAVDTPFAWAGISLKPYAPVGLGGGRTNGDLTIKWIRRGRIDSEWRDFADVPIGEDSEAYEIEIWDSGYNNLKRTIQSSTPSVIYSAADQTTDFGSAQPTVYVRVYQISADVGRGYPLQGAI